MREKDYSTQARWGVQKQNVVQRTTFQFRVYNKTLNKKKAERKKHREKKRRRRRRRQRRRRRREPNNNKIWRTHDSSRGTRGKSGRSSETLLIFYPRRRQNLLGRLRLLRGGLAF